MKQKEKISKLIDIVELLTKRLKKVELDVLKTNEIDKEIMTKLQKRIEELEALLAAQGSTGDDSELAAKLAEMTKERDKLKEDLAQYEIIEDDFADLKRLRQENEQLKSALEASGAEVPAAEVEEPTVDEPEPAAVAEPEEQVEPASQPVAEDPIAAAPTTESNEEEEKSPEDLLSEFEKMLG